MTKAEFTAAILLLGGEKWDIEAWGLREHIVIWDSIGSWGACIENEVTAARLGAEVNRVIPYDKMLERIVKYLEACNDRR